MRYKEIRVELDAGHTDVWRARDGTWDTYSLEDGAFVIRKGGALVGVYGMTHVISIKIE